MCTCKLHVKIRMFSFNGDKASRWHLLLATEQNAYEYLIDPRLVHVDSRKFVGRQEVNLYCRTKQAFSNWKKVLDCCVEVQRMRGEWWLLTCVLLKSIDELSHLARFSNNVIELGHIIP